MNGLMTKHRDYRNELEKALFVCGLSGSGFIKTTEDSLTGRPTSFAIPPEDIILSPDASDITTALRSTHVLRKHYYEIKQAQADEVWRDCELQVRRPQDSGPSNPLPTEIDETRSAISGIDAGTNAILHEVAVRLRLFADYGESTAPTMILTEFLFRICSLTILNHWKCWACIATGRDTARKPLEPMRGTATSSPVWSRHRPMHLIARQRRR
jgi:hypothetical protein